MALLSSVISFHCSILCTYRPTQVWWTPVWMEDASDKNNKQGNLKVILDVIIIFWSSHWHLRVTITVLQAYMCVQDQIFPSINGKTKKPQVLLSTCVKGDRCQNKTRIQKSYISEDHVIEAFKHFQFPLPSSCCQRICLFPQGLFTQPMTLRQFCATGQDSYPNYKQCKINHHVMNSSSQNKTLELCYFGGLC